MEEQFTKIKYGGSEVIMMDDISNNKWLHQMKININE